MGDEKKMQRESFLSIILRLRVKIKKVLIEADRRGPRYWYVNQIYKTIYLKGNVQVGNKCNF